MRTLLSAEQMDLRTLFEVKDVLNAKGFEVLKEGIGDDLLLPNALYRQPNYQILFNSFNDTLSRNEILKKINNPLFIVSAMVALPLINHVDFISDRNDSQKHLSGLLAN